MSIFLVTVSFITHIMNVFLHVLRVFFLIDFTVPVFHALRIFFLVAFYYTCYKYFFSGLLLHMLRVLFLVVFHYIFFSCILLHTLQVFFYTHYEYFLIIFFSVCIVNIFNLINNFYQLLTLQHIQIFGARTLIGTNEIIYLLPGKKLLNKRYPAQKRVKMTVDLTLPTVSCRISLSAEKGNL